MEHKTLTNQGYIVLKEHLNSEEISNIKKDLNVEPKTNSFLQDLGIYENQKFPIFLESKRRYWVPKYYGIEKFGEPLKTTISEGNNINLTMKLSMREHQIKPFKKTLEYLKQHEGGILSLPCGFGKCLGYGTKVALMNGKTKEVQDIKIGELLVGDDNNPRVVMNTTTGIETLYAVKQKYGINYTVNKSHILTLKHDNKIIDISLSDFLKKENQEDYYSVKIQREYKFVMPFSKTSPYLMGKNFIQYENYNNAVYLYGTVNERLLLLAGIIDYCEIPEEETEAYFIHLPYYEKFLIVQELVNGLGFGLIVNEKENTMTIYAHQKVPLQKKKVKITTIHLNEPVIIEELFSATYYGFTLNSNGRFLLEDNTVTHNTSIAINIITSLKKKTLVIVHKEFLMDQWKESIEKFSNASVGIIQQNKLEIQGNDICIGMMHSLCLKDYKEDTFKDFGFLVVDECHHLGSEMFSKVLCKIGTKYRLGLSATPIRRDGLHSVYNMHMGPIIYKEKRAKNNQITVRQLNLISNSSFYQTIYFANEKTKNTSKMVTNLTLYTKRNEFIIETLLHLTKQGRKILVLSSRRDHLHELKNMLEKKDFNNVGFYYGNKSMSKKEYKNMLFVSSKCTIILATEQLAKEGLDIPGLDTLVMTTSIADLGALEQSIGRILRKYYTDNMLGPLVIDIVDKNCGNFGKHGSKRKTFYKKETYVIEESTIQLDTNEKKETEEDETQQEEINFNTCVI